MSKQTALTKRINRLLRSNGEMLRKTRGARARFDFGDYYLHDLAGNFVIQTDVDVEELGRELGVLAK